MSLGALSCEYVMDVWRVWHFLLLLLTLEDEEAAASSVAAAHVLKRRQSSAAPVADHVRLEVEEGIILRVVW